MGEFRDECLKGFHNKFLLDFYEQFLENSEIFPYKRETSLKEFLGSEFREVFPEKKSERVLEIILERIPCQNFRHNLSCN